MKNQSKQIIHLLDRDCQAAILASNCWAQYGQIMKWISIKEELPQLKVSDSGLFSEPILVTNGTRIQVMSLYLHKFDDKMEFRLCCCSDPERWSMEDVTYWMPLPPLPEEGG